MMPPSFRIKIIALIISGHFQDAASPLEFLARILRLNVGSPEAEALAHRLDEHSDILLFGEEHSDDSESGELKRLALSLLSPSSDSPSCASSSFLPVTSERSYSKLQARISAVDWQP